MRMSRPSWYGIKYPTIEDLEIHASDNGAIVARGDIRGALYVPPGTLAPDAPPMILLPRRGPLETAWLLAHELGHLLRHSGAALSSRAGKLEVQADHWAARALIPESAIQRHGNASVDAFIAALSAHYEDIPLYDCPQRRLAAKIATIRLRAVEEVA